MLNKLLLGSAAVIVAVAGAQAADLPSKKAAPATYVKICDAYGAGFYTVPGTDTCVKLGGYFRGEYQYTPGKDIWAINGNTVGTKAGAALTAAQTAQNVLNGTAANVTLLETTYNTANAALTTPLTGQALIDGRAAYVATSIAVATGEARNYFLGGNPAGAPVALRSVVTDATKGNTYAAVGIAQRAQAQSETGYETRGRIDVDARTATSMGVARTFIRLRAANTSGARNAAFANNGISGQADASAAGISIESAFTQWAGFTFGIAGENFTQMPSIMYNGNPYTGFPNGMKQIAYTATFGGGLSATVALEDRLDSFQGSSAGPAGANYLDRLATAANLVANIRLDQSWGFASVAGMIGNNSVRGNYGYNPNTLATPWMTTSAIGAGPLGFSNAYASTFANTPTLQAPGGIYGTQSPGQATFGAWAVGATVNFKLPMIAAGDQIWFNANYGHGMLGATQGAGGLNNLSTAATRRLIGGILRSDQNLMVTGGNGSFNSPYTMGTVDSWNVATAFTHYWAPKWRSNFTAGYIQVNTPRSTATSTDVIGNVVALPQWGKGSVWEVGGNIVYSPAANFDIGLELQYSSMSNKIQNTNGSILTSSANGLITGTNTQPVSGATANMAIPSEALKGSNITTKLRVERTF